MRRYRERWRACGIPRGTPFRTKHELAAVLVEEAVAAGRVRAGWVVGDEGFGDSPALRGVLRRENLAVRL